ncbi:MULTISPECIES: acyl carrier protein [unclassified Tolypothrix]|uniref:acyl carrier protein n=1 Tax=unclassified Tolypothrix TaxID=2649714 RepID=UPI0005EAC369|nr:MULTISPECIES: acyl carrier protein [unclassified Tolypothrix]BAY91381.1 beta-ketoacyl synthase [Microchaete diplosiphon NIES-3275]EKF04490.1 phosphopantetheine attachment site [Tolypothrix sp. PCC 7601]MBE9080932.1 acyl carrier protein [Tolypothrix sp. LEGE 11397]UYD25434.1 acyl carrier protein [Tolypothrix sp. PCC 7712]UYD32321.1 acyl carrier protein [Tolypothrix sp. PCC 7601]
MSKIAFFTTYIQEEIAKVIGIETSDLDVEMSLNYLGLDSLIAVKLRNKFRKELSVDVPAVKFLEDTNVASLAILVDELSANAESKIDDDEWLEGEL